MPRLESRVGEAQENEAKDWLGVLLGSQTRVGAELIRGSPEPILKCPVGVVTFGWRDPAHQLPALMSKTA